MITAWLSHLTLRLTTRPTFSPETQALIDRYAPRDAETDRRLQELSLVVANAALMPAVIALTALLGWLTVADIGSRTVFAVYAGTIAVLLSGLTLHLARYYDASIGSRLSRQRPGLRWPRRSTDLDLFVQLAVGLVIAGAVAYQ